MSVLESNMMKSQLSIFSIVFIFIISFIILMRVFHLYIPLQITTISQNNELSVVGEGKIEATPDIAKIDAGISVNDVASVEIAQGRINTINNAILIALEPLGINKTDVTTSNYSIYPNITYDQNGKPNQRGFSGNVTLSIKVKNIQNVGAVIQTATKAGANQIQGTSFSIDHPETLRAEARNLAIKNAREQAQILAQSLGIRLGKITNIIESAPSNMMSTTFATLEKDQARGGGVAEFSSGTQTITSTVTLFFEKK